MGTGTFLPSYPYCMIYIINRRNHKPPSVSVRPRDQGFLGMYFKDLVAEFIGPKKVYTFSFIVGNIIPKSVKCIHSVTKRIQGV